ncbi:MAG: hypothetical protein JO036_02625 [Candidatus Eremiobacteraeota bacterium]|nr:hypothetical protein [Candidatus Eremiobacteraeota bacterium]
MRAAREANVAGRGGAFVAAAGVGADVEVLGTRGWGREQPASAPLRETPMHAAAAARQIEELMTD